MDESSLELLLKRKHFEETPIKVLNFNKQSNVVAKGENYLSTIERVSANVLLANGKQKKVSFIVKKQHETEHLKKMSTDIGVFVRECTMYRDILPRMKELLDVIGESGEVPWGNMVDFKLYDTVAFEDLSCQGYKMLNRQSQHGLHTAKLVLRELGKFHALSRMLIMNGKIPIDIFRKSVWAAQRDMFDTMINRNLGKLANEMKQWGEEWMEIAEKACNLKPDFATRLFDAFDLEPTDFTVLSHGDCWNNNMMFQYDEDPERPHSVKFIDFQLPFICTPARDLYYYFTTSVRQEVQQKHWDELVKTYADSLKSYLLVLGYKETIPSLDDVKEILRKRAIFEVADSFGITPVVLADVNESFDFEDEIKKESEAIEHGGQGGWNVYLNMNALTKGIIQASFRKAIETGVI